MKKLLEKQSVFNALLKFYSFLAQRAAFSFLTKWFTSLSAKVNILLNKPSKTKDLNTLAQTWLDLMPPDGQKHFKISEIKDDTAYAEIHLHCPLRGSGNAHACYKLMNYDRKLMEAVGGQLVVLESQSNSGEKYCKLAIRRKGESIVDLQQAHLK